jgi:hypothetical protein
MQFIFVKRVWQCRILVKEKTLFLTWNEFLNIRIKFVREGFV